MTQDTCVFSCNEELHWCVFHGGGAPEQAGAPLCLLLPLPLHAGRPTTALPPVAGLLTSSNFQFSVVPPYATFKLLA